MAKPHPEIKYHASPKEDLHKTGISTDADPTVTRGKSGWNYLGSHDYLHNQYLKYAPPGIYHIYQVDTAGLDADDSPLAGEQQRYGTNIDAKRVKKVSKVDTRKHLTKHPREQEYLDWFRSMTNPKDKS